MINIAPKSKRIRKRGQIEN